MMDKFYFVCYFKTHYDNSFVIKNALIKEYPLKWVLNNKDNVRIVDWHEITEQEYKEYKEAFQLLQTTSI